MQPSARASRPRWKGKKWKSRAVEAEPPCLHALRYQCMRENPVSIACVKHQRLDLSASKLEGALWHGHRSRKALAPAMTQRGAGWIGVSFCPMWRKTIALGPAASKNSADAGPMAPTPIQGYLAHKKRTPLGPCRRPMPRVPGGSEGDWRFLMGDVILYNATPMTPRLRRPHTTTLQSRHTTPQIQPI